MTITKIKPGKKTIQICIAFALFVVALSVAVPAAQAATVTYSNSSASASQVRTSSVLSIVGGTATTGLGGGTTTIITFRGYPGYSEVGHATGSNPHITRLSHSRASSTQSKCYWYWAGVGGTTLLKCTATT